MAGPSIPAAIRSRRYYAPIRATVVEPDEVPAVPPQPDGIRVDVPVLGTAVVALVLEGDRLAGGDGVA